MPGRRRASACRILVRTSVRRACLGRCEYEESKQLRESTRGGLPSGREKYEGRLWSREFLFIMAVALLMTGGLLYLVPILPLYVRELGGGEAQVGVVVGALALTSLFMRPLVGHLIDRYGRWYIVLASTVLTVIAAFLYPLATSIGVLILARIVHGAGWSGLGPATSTMAADIIPPPRRAEGFGYFGLSRSLGAAIGPALGITVAYWLGFSAAFWVASIFGVLALLMTFGMTEHYTPVANAASKFRLNPQSLYESSAILPSLVILCVTFVYGGLMAFVPLDSANRGLGNPATFFVVYAIALILIRPLAGRFSDQRGRGRLLIPGTVMVIAALLVLGLTGEWWTLSLSAILYAFGFGAIQPVIRAMILDCVPPQRWGKANATYGTAHDTGSSLGASALGFVAVQTGIPAMFVISALAAGIALLLVIAYGLHKI